MYEELADVLGTLRVLAELPPDCFGAYVISWRRRRPTCSPSSSRSESATWSTH
jgi:hypothetical protein